jgi:hypothetical protein
LLRGRPFDDRDTAESAPVVAINEALARRYFPGEDPLGKRIHLGHDRRPGMSEIVGVVGDVRHSGPGRMESHQANLPVLDVEPVHP